MSTSFQLQADSPSDKDDLKRELFAETVAKWLVLPLGSPGIVVGLEGSWGSGKSTLLKQVIRRLREGKDVPIGKPPIIVELNVWLVSETDAFIEVMLTQLAAAIGHGNIEGQIDDGIEVSKKILSYIGLLKNFRHLKMIPGVSWAGHIAEFLSDTAEIVGDGAEEAKKAAEQIKQALPKLDLARRKTELSKAIKGLGRPIIIALDDIDRLTDPQIRTVFQSVKAVADFENTTYLLAYDASVVSKAVGEGNSEAGSAYLEKIVQVAYPIPHLFPLELRQFFGKRRESTNTALGITIADSDEDRFREAEVIAASLCHTPRHVVRALNRYAIVANSLRDELCVSDLLILETLAVRFPQIWRKFYELPQLFVAGTSDQEARDTDDSDSTGTSSSFREHLSVWLGDNSAATVPVSAALGFLFPKSGTLSSHYAFAQKRVASGSRFRAYLSRAMPGGSDSRLFFSSVLKEGRVGAELRKVEPDKQNEFLERLVYVSESEQNFNANQARLDLLNWLWERSNQNPSDATVGPQLTAAIFLFLAQDTASESHKRVEGLGQLPILVFRDLARALASKVGERPRGITDDEATKRLARDARLWSDMWRRKAAAEIRNNPPDAGLVPYLLFGLVDLAHSESYCLKVAKEVADKEGGLEVFMQIFNVEPWRPFSQRLDLIWDIDDLLARLDKSEKTRSLHQTVVDKLSDQDIIFAVRTRIRLGKDAAAKRRRRRGGGE